MTEKQDNKNRNNNKFQRFKSEVFKSNAWASIIYFIFWYPPWTILCLIWVLCTGLISVILLLVFLPLGYFVCIGTVMSWRTLARVELIALSFCVNPSYFLIDTIPEITHNGSDIQIDDGRKYLQMKNQQELFGEKGTFVIKRLKEEKAFFFLSFLVFFFK
ncbi:hypothetical protein C1646_668666 [Rhizophagus diaphanus]|nr:hypothetical protein C1646_668666 [Rhizophagus diaphanus] [Rhizophagus sp. MUCL 43196]